MKAVILERVYRYDPRLDRHFPELARHSFQTLVFEDEKGRHCRHRIKVEGWYLTVYIGVYKEAKKSMVRSFLSLLGREAPLFEIDERKVAEFELSDVVSVHFEGDDENLDRV